MGEMADYLIDREIERMTNLDIPDDHGEVRSFPSIHPLDCDYWLPNDGRVLYPANGEMDENHIRNVMAMIRKPMTIEVFQSMEVDYYLTGPMPSGDGACDAFDSEFEDAIGLSDTSHGEYFNRRIRNSVLWLALRKGLTYHWNLKQKVNELNKGVLEL